MKTFSFEFRCTYISVCVSDPGRWEWQYFGTPERPDRVAYAWGKQNKRKLVGKFLWKFLNVSLTVIQLFKSGQCYITRAAAVVVRSHLFISLKFKFHSFFFLCNVCVRLVPWKKKLQNIWCIFSHFPIFGCLRIMLPCTWQLLLSTWNVWREMHYNSHCCAIRLLSALL